MTFRKSLFAAIGLLLPVAALTVSPASAQSHTPKKHVHHIHKHLHHAKLSATPAAEKPAS
jgi:hypothetical protein